MDDRQIEFIKKNFGFKLLDSSEQFISFRSGFLTYEVLQFLEYMYRHNYELFVSDGNLETFIFKRKDDNNG